MHNVKRLITEVAVTKSPGHWTVCFGTNEGQSIGKKLRIELYDSDHLLSAHIF